NPNAQLNYDFGADFMDPEAGAIMAYGVITTATTGGMTSAELFFDVDTDEVEGASERLLLSFLDVHAVGEGFGELEFTVDVEGAEVVNETFADLASAVPYFTDSTLDLGDWSVGLSPD